MTAAIDPPAARRKSSRSATAPRQKKPTPSGQTEAPQNSAKVVPIRRADRQSSPNRDLRSNRSSHLKSRSAVQMLPQPQPLPRWLKGLFVLQQGSMVITMALVVAGLGVYGWTVYTQQRWSDAYQRLENLQKRERQFLTTNEVLKNQMAQQAESPGTGLVPPDPNSTIFLSPAPLRPAAAPEVPPSPDTPIPARPLGY